MITCPVCGTENDDLSVTCSSCKGYLQAKVDTIDLFSTIWGLIESPRSALRKVILSRQKNYVLILGSLQGVAVLLAIARLQSLARGNDLALVVGLATVLGVVGGVGIQFLLGSFVLQVARSIGGKSSLRNMRAVIAYAGIPVVLWLVIILPIEFAIFGRYLFDSNPSPAVIQPVLYYALLGFDGLLVAWSLYLLSVGIGVANGITALRGAIVVLIVALVLAAAVVIGTERNSGSPGV